MYQEHTIAVVVPAYKEELLISRVIETMPAIVDWIVVVDDASGDDTAKIVRNAITPGGRLILLEHAVNQGVGGAIASGYTKGNRLFTGDAWNQIPKVRYLGNSAMSLLTKIASGYWHVADSQSGYTAINSKALETINWDKMYKRYGQPNDLLVRLNIHNFRVRDVPVTPIYNIGEISGVRPLRMIPRLSWLLLKLFIYRMWQKYVIRDFHPLLFFYIMAFFLLIVSVPLGLRVFYKWWLEGVIPAINALAWMSSVIAGLQSLFFAMWFDMEYNRELR
ncbi:MAG: ribonuclease BN [Anaerolineaceae bacterium 4572_5.1]|nr:MAG: ribonuclease BN [Anaerolineaceae bacterium 4572_5.1]